MKKFVLTALFFGSVVAVDYPTIDLSGAVRRARARNEARMLREAEARQQEIERQRRNLESSNFREIVSSNFKPFNLVHPMHDYKTKGPVRVPTAVLVHTYNGWSSLGTVFSVDIPNPNVANEICKELGHADERPDSFTITVENPNLMRNEAEEFLLRPQWPLVCDYNGINGIARNISTVAKIVSTEENKIVDGGTKEYSIHPDDSGACNLMASPDNSGNLGFSDWNRARFVLYWTSLQTKKVGVVILLPGARTGSFHSLQDVINELQRTDLLDAQGGILRRIFEGLI